MWLLFAWLVAEPHFHEHAGGVAGSAYELSQDVGPIWTGVAAGAVAYLIGAISQSGSNFIRAVAAELPALYRARRPDIELLDTIKATAERGERLITAKGVRPGSATAKLAEELDRRADQAIGEVQRELDLPATLLVGKQSELFAEVDRLRAEGELRMAVVPPLIGLTALLTCKASAWWLFLILALVTLAAQGLQKELDSRKLIADATRIGRVESSSVSKFAKWVDEVLPGEIARLPK